MIFSLPHSRYCRSIVNRWSQYLHCLLLFWYVFCHLLANSSSASLMTICNILLSQSYSSMKKTTCFRVLDTSRACYLPVTLRLIYQAIMFHISCTIGKIFTNTVGNRKVLCELTYTRLVDIILMVSQKPHSFYDCSYGIASLSYMMIPFLHSQFPR